MKGRAAIRIVIIASLYAVLHYTYNLFSLKGTLKEILTYWTSFLFMLILVNLAGFIIYTLLFHVRRSAGEFSTRSVSFPVTGSLVILCILVFTILGGGIYKIFYFKDIPLGELNELYPGFLLQAAVISLFTGIVLAVADHSLDSFRHLQAIRLSTRKLQTQQVNLRFESLKTQISPHFLFNSLNTISSLIYRDIHKAERFVRNLAAVYRKVLENYEYPLVSLAEELKLVEHYSYLMQVRFEDAFNFSVELPGEVNICRVPPLSVQMLVENAIKHNHMSQENPLNVNITTRDGYLVVRNNFIGDPGHVKIGNDLYMKPGPSRSTGVGLQNIKNRYRMISNKPVLISKDEYFTVSIPLIPANE